MQVRDDDGGQRGFLFVGNSTQWDQLEIIVGIKSDSTVKKNSYEPHLTPLKAIHIEQKQKCLLFFCPLIISAFAATFPWFT